MKSVYSFLIAASCMCCNIHLASCVKNSEVTAPAFCSTCEHVYIDPVAVEIVDSVWTVDSRGYFVSDLSKELRKVNDSVKHIVYIEIFDRDYVAQMYSGQTLTYLDGKFSLSGDILSFSATYNQRPFHTLKIRIMAY